MEFAELIKMSKNSNELPVVIATYAMFINNSQLGKGV